MPAVQCPQCDFPIIWEEPPAICPHCGLDLEADHQEEDHEIG